MASPPSIGSTLGFPMQPKNRGGSPRTPPLVVAAMSLTNRPRHGLSEWLGTESNRRHADFQSAALPTELPSPKPFNLFELFRFSQRAPPPPPRRWRSPLVSAADNHAHARRPRRARTLAALEWIHSRGATGAELLGRGRTLVLQCTESRRLASCDAAVARRSYHRGICQSGIPISPTPHPGHTLPPLIRPGFPRLSHGHPPR